MAKNTALDVDFSPDESRQCIQVVRSLFDPNSRSFNSSLALIQVFSILCSKESMDLSFVFTHAADIQRLRETFTVFMDIASEDVRLCGLLTEIDTESKRAIKVERIVEKL
ncbi:MAG: hypothetical protein HY606_08945 [Planctomycetes bacterium]|nr:hypothetical protein [Planctomycetota bacterium]